jgi:hypothetical protein
MELLGDVGHVEPHFGLFGAWCVPNVAQAQKSFWTHPMELLYHVSHVQSHFGLFGDIVCVSAR